jgi:hypothetical protein
MRALDLPAIDRTACGLSRRTALAAERVAEILAVYLGLRV